MHTANRSGQGGLDIKFKIFIYIESHLVKKTTCLKGNTMNTTNQKEGTMSERRSFLKLLGALSLAAGIPTLTGSFRSGHAMEVPTKGVDGGEKRIETATFALG